MIVVMDKYYAVPRGGQLPLFPEDIPQYMETSTSPSTFSKVINTAGDEEAKRQKEREEKYRVEWEKEAAFRTAFDKGIMFACDYIDHIMEIDREVRVSHNWPLHYDTLRGNVLNFIFGQRNRHARTV